MAQISQRSGALPSGVTGAVATLVNSGLVPRHYTTQGDFTTVKLKMLPKATLTALTATVTTVDLFSNWCY